MCVCLSLLIYGCYKKVDYHLQLRHSPYRIPFMTEKEINIVFTQSVSKLVEEDPFSVIHSVKKKKV